MCLNHPLPSFLSCETLQTQIETLSRVAAEIADQVRQRLHQAEADRSLEALLEQQETLCQTLLEAFPKDHRFFRVTDHFRQLAEKSLDVIYQFRLRPDLQFEYVSPAVELLLGYTPDEFYANPTLAYELLHPEDAAILKPLIDQREVFPSSMLLRYIHKNGSVVWVEHYQTPIFDELGKLVAVEAISRDVTPKKQVETAYQILVQRSLQGIFIIQEQCIRFANPAFAEAIGYTPDELTSLSSQEFRTIIHPDDRDLVFQRIRDRLAGKSVPPRYEFRLLRKDQSICWIEVFATVVEYLGRPAIQVATVDITGRKRTEAALRNSEIQLRTLIDNIPGVVYRSVFSDDWRDVFISDAIVDLIGYPAQEFMSGRQTYGKHIHPDDRENVSQNIIQAVLANQPYNLEYRVCCADNRVKWVIEIGRGVYDDENQPVWIDGVVFDITQRQHIEQERDRAQAELVKMNDCLEQRVQERTIALSSANSQLERQIEERSQVEAALRQSEERFRQLADNIRSVFWLTNADRSQIIYISPAYEQMWGRSVDELYQSSWNWLEAVHPDDRDRVLQSAQNHRNTESSIEYRIFRPDGEMRWIFDRGFPIRDEQGRIYRIAGFAEDITARKHIEAERHQAEQALRESQHFIQRITTATPNLTYIYDLNDRKTCYINRSATQLLGYADADLGNEDSLTTLFHPDEWQQLQTHFDRCRDLEDGEILEIELRAKDGQGEWRWFHVRNTVFARGEDGKCKQIVGVAQDITRRKQAEIELKMSQERLQYLLTSSPAVIYSSRATQDYATTFISDNVTKIVGYTPQEFLTDGYFWQNHLHPDDLASTLGRFDALMERGYQSYEYRFRHKNGSYVWMHDELQLICDEAGNPLEIVGFWADISEQKQAELERYQAEEKLRKREADLAEAQRIAHVGNWKYDLTTQKISWSAETFRIFGMEPTQSEPDFSEFWELVYPDDRPLLQTVVARAIDNQEPYEIEHRICRLDGSIGYVFGKGEPIVNTEGQVVRLFGTVLDISVAKHREAERNQAEEKLKASLLEKETLLKEIHHRVKNNLQIISSLLRLQSGKLEDASVLKLFHESQDRVQAMAMIHEQLYQSKDLSQINFRDYIQTLVANLFRSYGNDRRDIALKINVDSLSLNIDTAIPCGLIINELVSNALKYAFPIGQRGQVLVSLLRDCSSSTEQSPECELMSAEMKQSYILTVQDDGIGLPEAIDLLRIKSLGLLLVSRLARQLGGNLEIERSAGTTFKIAFTQPTHSNLA